MKRALLLALLLPAVAQAQEPLASDKRTALEAKMAATARKYAITLTFPTKQDPSVAWSHTYNPVTAGNAANSTALVDMFLEEFNKYPADFIKTSKLKGVLFVEDLAVQGQFRAAVPDYDNEYLLYDVKYAYHPRYMRHVIHHEFYHMLEEEWNGGAYFKDPNWAFLNPKDFKYGAGGREAYSQGDVWSFVHPKPGFINLYSTYGLEEDKAEIWAVMFVPGNWNLVKPFLDEDPVLRAKVSYMREYGRSKSPRMDAKFWEAVVK